MPRRPTALAILVLLLAVAAPTTAGIRWLTYKGTAAGNVRTVGFDFPFASTEIRRSGEGTFRGRYTEFATSTVNILDGSFEGSSIITTQFGDKVFYTFTGQLIPVSDEVSDFQGIFRITGGTGRFKRATGTGRFSGRSRATGPDTLFEVSSSDGLIAFL